MTEGWWIFLLGSGLTISGTAIVMIVKEAKWRGRVDTNLETVVDRVDSLEERVDRSPCASEIICLERRKEIRRELDAGVRQFTRIEECIKEYEKASQTRHDDNMKQHMQILTTLTDISQRVHNQ